MAERAVTPTSPSPSPPRVGDDVQADAPRSPAGGPLRAVPLPIHEVVRRDLETRTRVAVDALYEMSTHVAYVQPDAPASVGESVNAFVHRLAELDVMKGHIHTLVPRDVIENPDSHTRTFINRLASENQYSLAQHEALRGFHDQLGVALAEAFPLLAPAIRGGEEEEVGGVKEGGVKEEGMKEGDGGLDGEGAMKEG
ncbi:hypothetical protein MSPP1_000571 [Malassezia sp. CBS 17886]|nr:hypothetical protein MSPP1_000571 [Malassezia sp. CBS 17886]